MTSLALAITAAAKEKSGQNVDHNHQKHQSSWRITVPKPLVVLKVRHIVQLKPFSAAFSTSSSEWRLWHDAWNHLRTEREHLCEQRRVPARARGFVEKLQTCHTDDTVEWWCLRCSPRGRWDTSPGWHRGHTGCNSSATHT